MQYTIMAYRYEGTAGGEPIKGEIPSQFCLFHILNCFKLQHGDTISIKVTKETREGCDIPPNLFEDDEE